MRRLFHDRRGGAAVEFAIIAPVLGAILAVLVSVWGDATTVLRMRAAVHAGADYLRTAGADPELTRDVVAHTWESKPAGAVITVENACLCGEVATGCAVLCPSGDPPSVYVTIRAATGSSDQQLGRTYTSSEVVRVR